MELISIIMPAYNAAQFIEDAIKSVIEQTFENWELIVINDGSTDCTRQITERYLLSDGRIKLINQQNKMLGAARNAGLKIAKGSWVGFLDADDLWVSNKLQKQLEIIRSHPDIDVIYSSGWSFKNKDLSNTDHYKIVSGTFDANEMYKLEFKNNYIPVLSVLVKKTMVDKVGFQNESIQIQSCEDWDYWLRLSLIGARFFGMEERLFYYRRHSYNMSSDKIKIENAQLHLFLQNFRLDRFSKRETIRVFIPLLNSLIPKLIISNRRSEAKEAARSIKVILPLFSYLYTILTVLSNKSTIHCFTFFNRVYLKIKKLLRVDLEP